MLNWWLGRPVEGKYLQDGNPNSEAPETPAPVFAARALKSVIFGEPALQDDTIYDIERDEDAMAGKEAVKTQSRSLSPTKPPGILLTPGTATTKRKTVSFDNEVVDKDDEKKGPVKAGGKSGIPDDCPGKFPSPWSAKSETRSTRKTSLTKTLENAREGKAPRSVSEGTRSSSELQPLLNVSGTDGKDRVAPQAEGKKTSRPRETKRNSFQKSYQSDILDGDDTTDLNKPHSQSGRYWKAEYESYAEEAKSEMDKLLKYKELAKQYARRKDDEATSLAEQLKEEHKKVTRMESKISKLSAKIASASLDGPNETAEMVKELARQTALAVQYKAQVEEFRATLEGDEIQISNSISNSIPSHRRSSSASRTERNVDSELRRAREQLREMDALRDEVKQLRQNLATTEEKAGKLSQENMKLTQQLLHSDLRHTNHLEKCDKRRQSLDGQLQRKDDKLQSLQKEFDLYKETARASRRDSEQLLRQRHDQTVELRKEIASLRGAETTAQELQQALHKKTLAHEEVISHFQSQSEKAQESRRRPFADETGLEEERDHGQTGLHSKSKDLSIGETLFKKESQIPILTSISRPSKVLAPTKSVRSESPSRTPRPRSSQRALSEIVNGASVDTIPPKGSGPVQHTPVPVQFTPLTGRFSSISPEKPELQLPSPEPSILPQITGRTIHERNCHASPRPSIFNIASSPPKAALVRPRPGITSNELTKQRSNNNLAAHRQTNVITSQVMNADVSRLRREVPPERAAAAKARLEQKKRAKEAEAQKENIRN